MNSSSENQVDFVAHVLVMPVLLCIGFFGQLLNIFTLNQPNLRGVSFNYLKAIAYADLLSILSLIPFVLRHAKAHRSDSYIAMWYHAYLELQFINGFLAAGTLCIVALNVERYISVCHPVFTHKISSGSHKRSKITIFCTYFVAVFIFSPSCFQKRLESTIKISSMEIFNESIAKFEIINVSRTTYYFERNFELQESNIFYVYFLFREFVVRIGPIILLLILNLLILRSFHKVSRRHRRLFNNTNRNLIKRPSSGQNHFQQRQRDFYESEWKLYTLLVVTVVTFLICTLPASILSYLVTRKETPENTLSFQLFRATANLLEVLSYATNFYLYCLCSLEYRVAFVNMLKCRQRPSYDERRQNDGIVEWSGLRFRTRTPRLSLGDAEKKVESSSMTNLSGSAEQVIPRVNSTLL